MSIITVGKKSLAILLAIAILASCMVFSFSAAAAMKETLMWENDYDNATASNWASQYKGKTDGGPQNSGTAAGNYAYVDGGAMKLGFSSEAAETYASGYNIYHKAATHDDASVRYGYDGRYSGTYSHPYGIIRPENGTYKIKLDYKVESFNQNTASTVDLYIGYANELYWDGNVMFYTITDYKSGVYEKLATVDYTDVAKGWQSIDYTIELSSGYTPILYLFAKVMDNDAGDLTNAVLLVDNVKIYECEEIADTTVTFYYEGAKVGEASGAPGDPFVMPTLTGVPAEREYYADAAHTLSATIPTVYPDSSLNIYIKAVTTPTPSTKPVIWENNYNAATASNWASQYKGVTDRGPQNSGTVTGNYACVDGGAMKLGFSGEAAETYASGYNFYHQAATHNDASVRYGYDGRYSGTSSHPYGIIRPENGTYKIDLDYKLASFNQNTASTVELYVGYANELYWDGNVMFQTITNNKSGVYERLAAVDYTDIAKGWQSVSYNLTISTTYAPILFFFIKVIDNDADDLTDAVLLVDNVEIYEQAAIVPTTVTFYYEGAQVGEASGNPGDPFVMPTLTGVPAEREYYTDAAHTQATTIPTVYPDSSIDIYIKKTESTPTPPPPAPPTKPVIWENGYDNGTASNWASQYKGKNANGPQNSGTATGNYAYVNGGVMKLGFSTEAAESYASGYNFYHQAATHDDASVRYGYDGRYSGTSGHPYGIVRPENGAYRLDLDYKVESFNQNTASKVDLYVGYANELYWDGNVMFQTITNNKKGAYQKLATVDYEDVAKGWQSLSCTFSVSVEYTPILFIFAKVMDNSGNEQTNAVLLVDNVEIYERDASAFTSVTFYYEGSAVGTVSGAPGDPFTMPSLSGVPANREYYTDAAYTQMTTVPAVFPETSLDIHIKSVAPAIPMNTVMWKNHFDNGSTTNWMSRMGAADENSSFNSGRKHTTVQNYAVLKNEGSNRFMALGYGNYASREYLSGFAFFHEDATHRDPMRAGYVGNYSGTNFDVGNFYAPLGSYKVTLRYNLASLQLADAGVPQFDVYVAFGEENLYWDGNKQLERISNCCKMFTVTEADLEKGWQTATAYIENTTGYSMHFFIAQSPEYKNSLTDSELWIDDIEVSTSDYTSVTFYSGGAVVGQSSSAKPNTPFTMPMLTLPAGVPVGYKLLYYSDPACTVEIDVPTVYPSKSQKIYVKLVKEISDTWNFESETNGTKLSLNTRPETTIYVDDTVRHSGEQSARVNADAAKESANLYPQMLVKNGAGAQVYLAKGKNYEIKFYVYQPSAYGNYPIDYWFAVSGDDTVFDEDYDGAHSRKHGMVTEGTYLPTATDEWQEVTVSITDCAYIGKLRIGVIGDKNAAHPFYIDDITVTEMSSEQNVWSFDKETLGATLQVNTSDPGRTVTVDDFIKYSGYHSARINGNSKLINTFPQMMVKNDDGEQIYVYEGRSYQVKFRLYKPETQPRYDINYWLTATTESEDKEFNRDDYQVATYRVAGKDSNKVASGVWEEFDIRITNCAHTGKLRLGIAGDYNSDFLFFVDDIVVTEIFLEPDTKADSYERYDNGTVLSLNTDGASITVTDEDRRSGDQAVKVVTLGNSIDAAPQMIVNDFRREAFMVEKGKNYRVSFWVMRPIDEADYDIKYWLAATKNDAAFTDSRDTLLLDTTTVVINKAHVWQNVRVQIKDCPYSGTLRIGITGSTEQVHTFYIDDMYVFEDTAGDPDPKAMNFEMYEVGTNFALNQYLPDNATYNWNKNSITVTDEESYTGTQSVLVYSNNNMVNNRPHMLVRDGSGNVIRVKKGDDFFVSFMIYISPSAPYFSLNYWLTVTPQEYDDKPFFGTLSDNPEFSATKYMLPGSVEGVTAPDPGKWTEIRIAVMDCPYEGSLRIGLGHGNAQPYESSFYIDDIRVYDPEYVTVKFVTNGSQDKYDDIVLMSDMLIPMDNYLDPYREGYEFLGWYTDKNFSKDSYFDIYTQPVVGKTGDVFTLYARWREWGENVASDEREEQTDKYEYKTEYYTEKVWVGDQNVPQSPYSSDIPSRNDAAPIVITPQEDAPIPQPKGEMPPWLLVVIITAAVVVVGGGSALAAILLKKSKKA